MAEGCAGKQTPAGVTTTVQRRLPACRVYHPGITMNHPTSHIEPSKHSTKEVDEHLRTIEKNIEDAEGAGSPAIKPDKAVVSNAKPIEDHSKTPGK